MMYYGGDISGWGWALMGIGSVLFWALLIFGIVLLVRYFKGTSPWGNRSRTSGEELLAQRFARGEIDEAEYRQRLAVLAEQRQTTPSHF